MCDRITFPLAGSSDTLLVLAHLVAFVFPVFFFFTVVSFLFNDFSGLTPASTISFKDLSKVAIGPPIQWTFSSPQGSGCWEHDKGYDRGPILHPGAKTITLRSLRPYQKDRFIRVIQTVTKHITTPPFFIVPKGYGRDADCPSVPHTSDLSVKVFLYLGHGFSWVAQVNNDKVKAPEPSCYCSCSYSLQF